MRGRLVDLTFGLNRKQRITLELDDDFRAKFDELKDHDVRVEVKRYRKKRSLDANSYCWVLVDKIASELGISKVEVYRNAIRNIGGVSDVVCVMDEAVEKLRQGWEKHGLGWQTETTPSKIDGCTNVILYYGSSTYDTKQMSQLIDNMVQDAQVLGIETDTPDQIARYKEVWAM